MEYYCGPLGGILVAALLIKYTNRPFEYYYVGIGMNNLKSSTDLFIHPPHQFIYQNTQKSHSIYKKNPLQTSK